MRRVLIGMMVLGLLAGCGPQDMADQPRYEALEAGDRFGNDQAARHPPPHTVAFDARPAKPRPPLTAELLSRGRERFEIFCSPCHGLLGNGQGRIVQRGFPAPPTYHQPRLRDAPDEHLFNVISNGYGLMYPYGARISPRDRWAIVVYIRALQLSQAAPVDELGLRERLEGGP